MNNRLKHFLGKSINFNDTDVHPPSIDGISEIGEVAYNVYLALATFERETILKNLFGISEDNYETLSEDDTYEILTSEPNIVNSIVEAITFFVKKEIAFNFQIQSFLIGEKVFISKDNYSEFSSAIKEMNCIGKQEEMKFKNDRVKKKYKQMMIEKSKYNNGKSDTLELKDMLSILCSAEGNGINIFNCGQLKIYQVYEQFERVNVRENHLRTLQLWGNTYTLKEGTKLPEWIIKTKL